jgi:hypothetical protein
LTSLDQFFDTIVGKEMKEFLKGVGHSSFFLLSCGSVVQVKEAQDGLKRLAKS